MRWEIKRELLFLHKPFPTKSLTFRSYLFGTHSRLISHAQQIHVHPHLSALTPTSDLQPADASQFIAGWRGWGENFILNLPTALKNLKPNNPQSAIMHKIAKIDKFGTISIPVKMREALSLKESTAVYIIDRNDELIIRPIHTRTPDAAKNISKMNLPVDDWETMEQEIESGAVNG